MSLTTRTHRRPAPAAGRVRHRGLTTVVGGALTAGALMLATACGTASASGSDEASSEKVDLSQVTLVAGDQKGVSAQAMLEAAGLDDTPYKIQWNGFTSGPPMLEALGAGAIDVALVGNTPPIFAAASGSSFKVVAAHDYTGEGDAIIVPKDSTLTSVEQLRGKTVAVAPGSSANYNLLGQLTKAGLTLDDISVKELQPSDALAAFTSGHIDAWAAWEPYVSQAQIEDDAKELVNGDNGVMNGLGFEVASDEAIADPETRAALADYIRRIQAAQEWVGSKEHADEWATIWAQQAGLSKEITANAVAKRPVRGVPIDQSVIDSTQTMADAFYKAGQLPAPVDISEYFTTDFNASSEAGSDAKGSSSNG